MYLQVVEFQLVSLMFSIFAVVNWTHHVTNNAHMHVSLFKYGNYHFDELEVHLDNTNDYIFNQKPISIQACRETFKHNFAPVSVMQKKEVLPSILCKLFPK